MNKSKLTNSYGCQVHWLNVRDRTSQSALIVVNQCVYHFHPHTHWPTVASPTVPIVQWVPPVPAFSPLCSVSPLWGIVPHPSVQLSVTLLHSDSRDHPATNQSTVPRQWPMRGQCGWQCPRGQGLPLPTMCNVPIITNHGWCLSVGPNNPRTSQPTKLQQIFSSFSEQTDRR